MLPLSAHDSIAKIRKATGYTQTQAIIAAVEAYIAAFPQDYPQWPQRGVDRAPLRIVLPQRTNALLERLKAGYAQEGKKVSRQDLISEVLRTYSVRS